LESVVTSEDLPWFSELEVAGAVIRDRTKPAAESKKAKNGLEFLSTEGAQVTTHCEFRGEQLEVKAELEKDCPTGDPAGSGLPIPATSIATRYNPETKKDEEVGADGFAAWDIDGRGLPSGSIPAGLCGGEGLGLEELENGTHSPTPGAPLSINVPGYPVITCEGENAPKTSTGASGSHPSEIIFDQPATGELECGPFGGGTTTGSLKSMGYSEGQIISTKTP